MGTATNNQLGSANIVRLDEAGRFTTIFRGASLPKSYRDSGSPTYVLADPDLDRCVRIAWAYCGDANVARVASIAGSGGMPISDPFRIGNYDAFARSDGGASDTAAMAAEPSSAAFVWGAPLFFGKRVFVVTEGSSIPGSPGLNGPFTPSVQTLARTDRPRR